MGKDEFFAELFADFPAQRLFKTFPGSTPPPDKAHCPGKTPRSAAILHNR
jgi:hypothetical protein